MLLSSETEQGCTCISTVQLRMHAALTTQSLYLQFSEFFIDGSSSEKQMQTRNIKQTNDTKTALLSETELVRQFVPGISMSFYKIRK